MLGRTPTSDPSQQKSDSHDQIPVAEFKVVLVGDSGVGKSTFLERFGGERKHDTANNADIQSIEFVTTIGLVKLNIWEPSTKITPEDLKEGFILGADFGIIMFDFNDRLSYKNCPTIISLIKARSQSLILNIWEALLCERCPYLGTLDFFWIGGPYLGTFFGEFFKEINVVFFFY